MKQYTPNNHSHAIPSNTNTYSLNLILNTINNTNLVHADIKDISHSSIEPELDTLLKTLFNALIVEPDKFMHSNILYSYFDNKTNITICYYIYNNDTVAIYKETTRIYRFKLDGIFNSIHNNLSNSYRIKDINI